MKFLNIFFLFSLLFSHFSGAQDLRPDSHAPIGVMGDHTHAKGEWMLSYRYMHMQMEGNRVGTDEISPEEIVTTVPNRFAGLPMQPPTLRVVPTEMSMDMHMFGVMYAPTDWLTLMAMTMLTRKEMNHITFQGGMGTNRLGNFTTLTNGLGDTKISGLFRVLKKENHRLHLNAGLSIPTGSVSEEDRILTPMDAQPEVRLPYPMQLGSGTFDLLPGITYAAYQGRLAWGAQVTGALRLGENDEGYSFGNALDLTSWGSYRILPWLSTSLRLAYHYLGEIDGIDDQIVAPVQTANPDFQGGQRLDASLGVNLVGLGGWIKNHRLALEFDLPVYQDLNGPQLEVDYNLTVGWQFAF